MKNEFITNNNNVICNLCVTNEHKILKANITFQYTILAVVDLDIHIKVIYHV